MSELLPSCEGEFPMYECDRPAIGVVFRSGRNIDLVCAEHWGDALGVPLVRGPGSNE